VKRDEIAEPIRKTGGFFLSCLQKSFVNSKAFGVKRQRLIN
jgi:hypothetical protein